MRFIDLHTHIAYQIDDGAMSLEETQSMLEQAYKQGYEGIVMTPHINKTVTEEYINKINHRYNELQVFAKQYNIQLYLGSEILLDENTLDILSQQLFYSIHKSDYILIECNLRLHSNHIFDYLDEYLNVLLSKGYKPIIAHVERYFSDAIDLNYIEYLIAKGCYIQINTNSLLDIKAYKKVKCLLDRHMVHFIASDAHFSQGKRIINMKQCFDVLCQKKYDPHYIEDLMYNNAYNVVNNRNLSVNNYKKRNLLYKIIKA